MAAIKTHNGASKEASTRFPIHPLLRQRWSPRAFDTRPVSQDDLGALLEAARWAASSYNEQPWRFVVVTRENTNAYERLLGTLSESNRSWAHRAPVLILTVAKTTLTRSGKPNRCAVHDVALAVANLVFQATELGIMVRQMQGFDAAQAGREMGVPEGFEPVTVLAVGYEGNPLVLSEVHRHKELAPRERMPVEEIAFAGRWGEAIALPVSAEPTVDNHA